MVVVEGIETVDEAYIALDANADFAQGFFFDRPQAGLIDDTCICYLLDDQGQRIGNNLWSGNACPQTDPRLAPLKDTCNARWSRSPYFRRAIEHFGTVQVNRPYL